MNKVLPFAALALCVFCAGASAHGQAYGAPVAINAVYDNLSPTPIAIVAFCSATLSPKDIEGYVWPAGSSLDLIASESGTPRESITIIVPSGLALRGQSCSRRWRLRGN